MSKVLEVKATFPDKPFQTPMAARNALLRGYEFTVPYGPHAGMRYSIANRDSLREAGYGYIAIVTDMGIGKPYYCMLDDLNADLEEVKDLPYNFPWD